MSTNPNGASASAPKRVVTPIFVAALILAGLAVPLVAAWTPGFYVRFVGPPLDFGAPHDGQVVVHIDVLAKAPPDIARIRVSEMATGVTVWDVKPTTAQS